MKNKDVILEEKNKVNKNYKKILILFGMLAVIISVVCGYIFYVRASISSKNSKNEPWTNHTNRNIIYGYSGDWGSFSQVEYDISNATKGEMVKLVENTNISNNLNYSILEQFNIFCIENGTNLDYGTYYVGEKKKVQDPLLANILAQRNATGTKANKKDEPQKQLWKYLNSSSYNSADKEFILR